MRQAQDINRLWAGNRGIESAIQRGARKALNRRNGERRKEPRRFADDQTGADRWQVKEGRNHLELDSTDLEEISSEASLRLVRRLERSEEWQPLETRSGAAISHDLTDSEITGLAYGCGVYACKSYLRERAKKGATERQPEDIDYFGRQIDPKTLVDTHTEKTGGRPLQSDEWERLQDQMHDMQEFEDSELAAIDRVNALPPELDHDDYAARAMAEIGGIVRTLPKRGNFRAVALFLASTDWTQEVIAEVVGTKQANISRTIKGLREKLPATRAQRLIIGALTECQNEPEYEPEPLVRFPKTSVGLPTACFQFPPVMPDSATAETGSVWFSGTDEQRARVQRFFTDHEGYCTHPVFRSAKPSSAQAESQPVEPAYTPAEARKLATECERDMRHKNALARGKYFCAMPS